LAKEAFMLEAAIVTALALFVFIAVFFITGDTEVSGRSAAVFVLGGVLLVIAFQIYNDGL